MALHVGFIGTGGIAQTHLRHLQQLEGVAVVAACDLVRERAEAAVRPWGGRAYTDHREMLARERLDALFICLPPFAHTDQELLAVEKGIPFFVEKPLEVGTAYAEQVAAAVQARGLLAAVGYHWRYMDGVERAQEILASRPAHMALGYWLGGMPGVAWWRVQDQSGGQMIEQTTHIVDLARYLVGEVEAVWAAFAHRALTDVPGFTATDVGTVALRFASGAVGSISNTCILSQGHTVGLDLLSRDLVLEIRSGYLRVTTPEKVEEWKNRNNPYLKELQAFLHAVRTGDPSGIRSPYADALRTQRVTVAATESARTGQVVHL